MATKTLSGRRFATASALCAGTAYLTFVAVTVYAVLFLAGAPVPRSIDKGPAASTSAAVGVDLLLLSLFALQHSVMARSGVKRWLTRAVPAHLERSTYVLASSAVLALLFWQWRPIRGEVWHVDPAPSRVAVWILFGCGWAWAFAMTFAIDHLDMFGLRQAGLPQSEAAAPARFRTPWPYRLVRHPMMLGFFVAFLATPTMTAGHLLFAALACGYVVVGVWFEERDLRATFPEYGRYAETTGRFLPRAPR